MSQKFRAAWLSPNPTKCAFRVAIGTLRGHIVSQEGIDLDKVKAIFNALGPKNAKALNRFLGQSDRTIEWFGTSPILLHHYMQRSIRHHCHGWPLKVMLSQVLVVQPSYWARPFHVFVDASNIAIGNALMQLTEPNRYRPIYYSSQNLSTIEWNYSMIEWQALGMIYSVDKFQHYLLGRKFTFHVDHVALLYLVMKQSLMGKLVKWMLLL